MFFVFGIIEMSTFNYLDAISIYLRLVSSKMKVKMWNLENIWRYHSILHNHLLELPFRKHRCLHSNWKPQSVYHSSSSTMKPFCLKQPSPPKGMPDALSAWKGSPTSPQLTSLHSRPQLSIKSPFRCWSKCHFLRECFDD